MPRPYSADLRERALVACEEGRLSRAAIAAQFRIGETTLYRWLQEWRAEGRRACKPHAGGKPPRLDEQALDELCALVAEQNDATLAEYAARLAERAAIKVSRPTLCRALQNLKLKRKKKPSGQRSRTGPRSRRNAPITWPRSVRSILGSWSSSMRAG
jgi:transposase